MKSTAPLNQARFIYATGRLIHERIYRIKSRQFALGPYAKGLEDLSVQQLQTLTVIRHHGTVSITELASLMGVSPPSASAMVDRLVEKKLLTREPDPSDRRKVVVRVTPVFEGAAEQVEAGVMQTFVDLVEKIGPETAGQWCEVLARIKEHLVEDIADKTEKSNSIPMV